MKQNPVPEYELPTVKQTYLTYSLVYARVYLKERRWLLVLKILQAAIKEGYLLHGSPNILEGGYLDPGRAQDDFAQVGIMKVYAIGIPAVAVFRAVIRGSHIWWGYEINAGRLLLTARNVELENGWVHILSPATFTMLENPKYQLYSSILPVTPIQSVAVTPGDLYAMQSEIGFTLDIAKSA
jgi:hypothetical protein